MTGEVRRWGGGKVRFLGCTPQPNAKCILEKMKGPIARPWVLYFIGSQTCTQKLNKDNAG